VERLDHLVWLPWLERCSVKVPPPLLTKQLVGSFARLASLLCEVKCSKVFINTRR
jgi:hypothetical protein